MIPVVVVRAAGGSEAYLPWALFAAVSICGLTTILQALRIGRFGSGYVAVMGTSLAVVGVGVTAIAEGGPGVAGDPGGGRVAGPFRALRPARAVSADTDPRPCRGR